MLHKYEKLTLIPITILAIIFIICISTKIYALYLFAIIPFSWLAFIAYKIDISNLKTKGLKITEKYKKLIILEKIIAFLLTTLIVIIALIANSYTLCSLFILFTVACIFLIYKYLEFIKLESNLN